jgi:hypothetical protein
VRPLYLNRAHSLTMSLFRPKPLVSSPRACLTSFTKTTICWP